MFQKLWKCPLNVVNILNNSKSLILQVYEKRFTVKFNWENDEKIYFLSHLQL